MTPDRLRQQIAYLIGQGWNPAIEHTEPERSFSSFWYLWKLPFFGEKSDRTHPFGTRGLPPGEPRPSRAPVGLR